MKLLDRYIFTEVLRPALLGVALYTFVLMMNQFFLLVRLAIQKNMAASVLAEIVALQLPRIALLTVPMGILLGVLIGLGRLAADSEIVALRASGISYTRMTPPILLLGLAGFVLGLCLYNFVSPTVRLREARLKTQVVAAGDPNTEIRPGVFYDSITDVVLYAAETAPQDRLWPLRRIFVHARGSKDGPDRVLVGRRGAVARDPKTGLLVFRVDQGELHLFDASSPGGYSVSRFQEPFQQALQTTAPPPGQDSYRQGVEDRSTPELNDIIRRRAAKARGGSAGTLDAVYRKAWVERDQRFAVPFAAIVFALVAIPLGLVTRRGGRAAGFALSLIIIIIYWVSFTIGRELSLDGKIPLPAGAWAPNVVLLLAALALIILGQKYDFSSPIGALAAPLRSLAARLPGIRLWAGAAPSPRGWHVRAVRGAPPGWLHLPHLQIIDRYIALLFLRLLVLVVASVYTILWVVVSRNLLDSFGQGGLPPWVLLQYLLAYSPGAAQFVLPISSVVAALTTISLLEKNSEIVALRASGVSVYRASLPLVAATLAVCAGYYFIQEYIAPATNQAALRIEDTIEGRTGTVSPGERWIFGREGQLYSYQDYDPSQRSFQGLSVIDLGHKGQQVRRRIWAERASWTPAGWRVQSGWVREWGTPAQGAAPAPGRFEPLDGRTVSLPEGPDFFDRREETFLKGARLPEQMSFQQLREHLRLTRRSGYDVTHLRVALYAKTAMPLAPLVMVLIGLPFAFGAGRKGTLYGLGIALGLVIAYWAVFAVFNGLGLEGVVPAFLSAWAPNVLFALSGVYLLLSVRS